MLSFRSPLYMFFSAFFILILFFFLISSSLLFFLRFLLCSRSSPLDPSKPLSFLSHHAIHPSSLIDPIRKTSLSVSRVVYLSSSFSLSPFLSFRCSPSPHCFRHRSSIDVFSLPTFSLLSHFRRSILFTLHLSLPSFVLSFSCF